MASRVKSPAPSTRESAFERRFRVAARRVLKRRGVAENRIDGEIERLRRTSVKGKLPTVAELEKALAEAVDAG